MLKIILFSAAAGSLLLASFPARCGPPFSTDDPEPVEYRHHELNIAYQQVTSRDGRVASPLVEYNYGALPDLQLSITVPYVMSSPTGQVKQQGVGDLVLGAKYRILQETDSQPMVAVYPVFVSASGDANRGLGNGGAQVFLPIWIQKKWGDWQSYGGGGYWINRGQGAGNHWYFGLALQNNISEHLTLGGEIFRQTDQLPLENSVTGYSLGGIYNLDTHNRLLMSVGRGIAEISSQNSFSSYIGYGLSW